MSRYLISLVLLLCVLVPTAQGGSSYPGTGIPGEVLLYSGMHRLSAANNDSAYNTSATTGSGCMNLDNTAADTYDCSGANAGYTNIASGRVLLTKFVVTAMTDFEAADGCDFRLIGDFGTAAITDSELNIPEIAAATVSAGDRVVKRFGYLSESGIFGVQAIEGTFRVGDAGNGVCSGEHVIVSVWGVPSE